MRMMIVKPSLAILALVCGTAAQSQYASSAGGRGGAGGFGGAGGGGAGAAGGTEALQEAIPGVPGEDYPIYSEVPETSFVCDGQADGGYYADPEAECQAFHICAGDGNGGLTKFSFLCPNGTLFQQQYFVCDWWFNVDCSTAEDFYSLNDENAAERLANTSPEALAAGGGGDQYQGGAANRGGAGGHGGAGGRGGGGGRGGSRGSSSAASSPSGSYSSPSQGSYSSPSGGSYYEDGGAIAGDAGYGAPGDGGFVGAAGGYGAPGFDQAYQVGRTSRQRNFHSRGTFRRRNSRELGEVETQEYLKEQPEQL